jgi:hypothetical protein
MNSTGTCGVTPAVPSEATNEEIAEWAERHDLRGSATDLRCAFEDAASLHLTRGVSEAGQQTLSRQVLMPGSQQEE